MVLKKGHILLLVVLVAVLVLGACFGPGIYRTVRFYKLAEDFLTQPSQSLDMTLMTGGKPNLDFRLDWQQAGQKRIVTLEAAGESFYCHDGVIYLKNGKGYRFSRAIPDLSAVLEQPWLLLPLVQIQKAGDTWLLSADLEGLNLEFQKLNVTLEEGEKGIRAVYLDTMEESSGHYYALRAVCREDRQIPEIPGAVLSAMESGAVQADKDLTEDVLRLFRGWMELYQTDPLGLDMDIRVDLLELPLGTELTLSTTRAYGTPIHYLHKEGLGFYFTDTAACTPEGVKIDTPDASVDVAKLPGLAYYLCFNGDLRCEGDLYRLELDQEGMSQVLYAVAPQTKDMALTLTGGALELEMKGDSIAAISLQVAGQVDLVITRVDIGAQVRMEIRQEYAGPEIPEKVLQALLE